MNALVRTLAVTLALAAAGVFAGEAEWKARYDAANEARMHLETEKSKALFAALEADIEAALKEELAKGNERPETATAAYWLASVYLYQNRYPNAAVLLKIALEIRTMKFGENSAQVAEVYDKIAWLGADADKVVAIMRRALAIREKVYGPVHRELVTTLRDIGMNRLTSSNYGESEAAYERAIAICEKLSGPEHLDVAQPLSDLAWLRVIERRHEEAIPLYQRALAIVEKSAAPDTGRVAEALENLAYAYQGAKRYPDAEGLYLRAIPIREKLHGPKDILTITPIGRLKDIYDIQGRRIDAWKLGRKLEAAR